MQNVWTENKKKMKLFNAQFIAYKCTLNANACYLDDLPLICETTDATSLYGLSLQQWNDIQYMGSR